MTTDGNFNANNINTVNIPSILKCIGASGMAESASFTSIGSVQYYTDANYFYTVGGSTNTVWRAPITDIMNGIVLGEAQPAGQTQFFSAIYPTPIGSYYYNFSTVDDLGGDQGGAIYRAPKGNPTAWYLAGSSPSNATHPMIYYDNTNVYLIGGHNKDTIDFGSDPIALAASGNVLPAVRVNAPLITQGSTIYMYGGLDATDTEVDTVYSAATSDPTTWTDLGSLLPVPLSGAAAYNDGVNIWLFGGNTTGPTPVNTIYQATVGAPTTFSSVGTIPSAIANLSLFVHGAYAYLIGYSSGNIVYRAALSDLTTWTTIQPFTNALSTGVRASHSVILNNTIYLFGGNTAGTTRVNTIQTAPTSNPLQWTASGDVLPATMAGGQLLKTKNYLYLLGADGTSGSVYRAPIATPTVFTFHDGNGPTRPHGKALIVNGHVFYLGGESAVGTPVTTVYRGTLNTESSPTGDLIAEGWQTPSPPFLVMALPIALSRFALIVTGRYAYILGGYTTGPAMNSNIYRVNLDSVNGGWTNVGSLSNPMVDPALVLINDKAFLIGGGPTTAFSTTDDYITYASLSDLSNGDANFTEVNTATGVLAESSIAVVNDDIYIIGGRSSTNAVPYVYRTYYKYPHTLISPRVPEATHSMPTVDLQSGALGSYTSFQRTGGLYPWLVTDI